jgi:hypothetical protein
MQPCAKDAILSFDGGKEFVGDGARGCGARLERRAQLCRGCAA